VSPQAWIVPAGGRNALAGRTLVAHAAWVEDGCLRSALARAQITSRGPAVHTMAVGAAVLRARGQTPGAQMPLTALAEQLSLPVHRPHHADGDALTTAQVFLAAAAHMEAAGRGTLGDLVDPDGSRPKGLLRRPWRRGLSG
jgi:DNA polymerase III subunit epsilon